MNRMWRSVTVFAVYLRLIHALSHIKIRHYAYEALRAFPGPHDRALSMYYMVPIGIVMLCLIGKSKSYGQIHRAGLLCDYIQVFCGMAAPRTII